jgi:hypothetical protein
VWLAGYTGWRFINYLMRRWCTQEEIYMLMHEHEVAEYVIT